MKNKTDMTVAEKKAALMTPGTIFTMNTKLYEDKEFQTYSLHGEPIVGSIYENTTLGRGMSVDIEKGFGPVCVWLFTFNMLGQKITGKIRYEDVTIVEIGS